MILVYLAYIVFVLVLYRLESAQLDREALRQGRLTIVCRPSQQEGMPPVTFVLPSIHGCKVSLVPWCVEDDDEGW